MPRYSHVRAILGVVLLGTWPASLPAQEGGPENVRLVFQLIEADGFQDVDPAVADVVQELREVFRFEGYRLLTTSVLTGVSGTSVSQRLRISDHEMFDLLSSIAKTQDSTTVSVGVELRDAMGEVVSSGRRIPGPNVLEASVTVRDGQTVVLGSASRFRSPESRAMILVMRVTFDPQGN